MLVETPPPLPPPPTGSLARARVARSEGGAGAQAGPPHPPPGPLIQALLGCPKRGSSLSYLPEGGGDRPLCTRS